MEAKLKNMRVAELKEIAIRGGLNIPGKTIKEKIITQLLALPNLEAAVNGGPDEYVPAAQVGDEPPAATEDDFLQPPPVFDWGSQAAEEPSAPIASTGPAHVPQPIKVSDPSPAASNAYGSTAKSAVATNSAPSDQGAATTTSPLSSVAQSTGNGNVTTVVENDGAQGTADAPAPAPAPPPAKPMQGSSKPDTDVDVTALTEEERRKKRAKRFQAELNDTRDPPQPARTTATTKAAPSPAKPATTPAKPTAVVGSTPVKKSEPTNGAATAVNAQIPVALAEARAKRFSKQGATAAETTAAARAALESSAPAQQPIPVADDLKVLREIKFGEKKPGQPGYVAKTGVKRSAEDDAPEPDAKRQKSDAVEVDAS